MEKKLRLQAGFNNQRPAFIAGLYRFTQKNIFVNGIGGMPFVPFTFTSTLDSHCYNAGTIYHVGTSVGFNNGSLFGGGSWVYITHWLGEDALKISNVFAYGSIVNPYTELSTQNNASVWNIISGGQMQLTQMCMWKPCIPIFIPPVGSNTPLLCGGPNW